MEHKTFFLGIKGLVKNNNGKILVLLKNPGKIKNLGLSEGIEYWDIPGGRIKQGDTIEETLKREIREEIGLVEFENKGLFYATISNISNKADNNGLVLFIYECGPLDNFEIKLSEENIKYDWVEKEKAAELLKINFPPDFIKKLAR